jgi:hypothetical protein
VSERLLGNSGGSLLWSRWARKERKSSYTMSCSSILSINYKLRRSCRQVSNSVTISMTNTVSK